MTIDIWKPLAGLMLFLLALSLIEKAIQSLSGRRFRLFLANNTTPPLKGVISGTLATAILQSSSLVSLMMLAFVGAGVIQLKNALSIVFGANLGTTATGWIVATIGFKLDLEAFAFPLIALGGLAATVARHSGLRFVGNLTLGLGLLLLALQFMKGAVDDAGGVATHELLASFGPLEFLLFGAVLSAIIQSSSAVMAVALSALHGGIIELQAAAVLVIGADLGTTSTVLLGAVGGTPNKKRIAMGHFLFNVATDVIAFAVHGVLLAALAWIQDPLLTLVAFHTTFNLIGIGLFLPVIGVFSRFLQDRFQKAQHRVSRYLEESVVAIPEIAIENLDREVGYLIERTIAQNVVALRVGDMEEHVQLVGGDFAQAYDVTKALEGEILTFSYGLDRLQLSEAQSKRVEEMLQATRDAVLASKACKDVLGDVEALQRSGSVLEDVLLGGQEQFYERVSDLMAQETMPIANIEQLVLAVATDHTEAHERIHEEAGRISGMSVSQVLNLNRLLFNSQQYLLSSICQWVGVDVLTDRAVGAGAQAYASRSTGGAYR